MVPGCARDVLRGHRVRPMCKQCATRHHLAPQCRVFMILGLFCTLATRFRGLERSIPPPVSKIKSPWTGDASIIYGIYMVYGGSPHASTAQLRRAVLVRSRSLPSNTRGLSVRFRTPGQCGVVCGFDQECCVVSHSMIAQES